MGHRVEFPPSMSGATGALTATPMPWSSAISGRRASPRWFCCAATTSRRARRSRRTSTPRYAPASRCRPESATDAAENDGWVLAARHDRELDRSDLVVLDANEFGGGDPVAVQLPRRVPCGTHGSWVAD